MKDKLTGEELGDWDDWDELNFLGNFIRTHDNYMHGHFNPEGYLEPGTYDPSDYPQTCELCEPPLNEKENA
jgi:hypothetical protein